MAGRGDWFLLIVAILGLCGLVAYGVIRYLNSESEPEEEKSPPDGDGTEVKNTDGEEELPPPPAEEELPLPEEEELLPPLSVEEEELPVPSPPTGAPAHETLYSDYVVPETLRGCGKFQSPCFKSNGEVELGEIKHTGELVGIIFSGDIADQNWGNTIGSDVRVVVRRNNVDIHFEQITVATAELPDKTHTTLQYHGDTSIVRQIPNVLVQKGDKVVFGSYAWYGGFEVFVKNAMVGLVINT